MGSLGGLWRPATMEEFRNLKLVASTPNARVFRGFMDTESGKMVDVAVRKPRITSQDALQRFFDEVQLRSRIAHPHVCELLAASTVAPNYLTVSPWFGGGCLFDVIHGQSVRFGYERILHLGLQFAFGLQYLHRLNLLHRDLKTANLLIDVDWRNLSIADLDLAIDADHLAAKASESNGRALGRGPSNGRLKHMVGTLVYMAPEVLSGAPHSAAADVYAFGITLNEIAAASVPFVDRQLPVPELHTVLETRFNEVKLRRAIVKDGLRPSLAKHCPDEFTDIIQRCWDPKPENRPSMDQVVAWLQASAAKGTDYVTQFGGAAAVEADAISEDVDRSLLEEIVQMGDAPLPLPAWNSTMRRDYVPDAVEAGVSSTAGARGDDRMEDRDIIEMHLAGMSDVHLVGVYDGHGGYECAQFVKDHLVNAVARRWTVPEATQESCLIHAYEDVDAAFLASTPESQQSGCTALSVLVAGGELFVANVGDCRAVLCRNGQALQLSKDQTAADATERARVEARGGKPAYHSDLDQWRINGEIAVSRSIGDRRLKPALTSTPEVLRYTLQEEDEFIVLATDGLWDVITNEEAIHMVKTTVRVADLAAKRLALKALIERESKDNITVIVVHLKPSNGCMELKQ